MRRLFGSARIRILCGDEREGRGEAPVGLGGSQTDNHLPGSPHSVGPGQVRQNTSIKTAEGGLPAPLAYSLQMGGESRPEIGAQRGHGVSPGKCPTLNRSVVSAHLLQGPAQEVGQQPPTAAGAGGGGLWGSTTVV